VPRKNVSGADQSVGELKKSTVDIDTRVADYM
jgi:hypothetical protein